MPLGQDDRLTLPRLTPKDWDPLKRFREMNLGAMGDANPKVLELMREMRATWNNAPTNSEMDGAAVKLPGYVGTHDMVRVTLEDHPLTAVAQAKASLRAAARHCR